MSDRISRRALLRGAAIGALAVAGPATYCMARKNRGSALLGAKPFEISNLPVPEVVGGPFSAKACLSPDEKTILVAGRSPIPPEAFEVLTKSGNAEKKTFGFIESLTQTISMSPWPLVDAKDYHTVLEIPAAAFIEAVAVSPTAPAAAFLVRESWPGRDYPDFLVDKIDKTKPFCDVLYTVSLEGGKPDPIAVLKGGYSLEESVFTFNRPRSICWREDGHAIYFYDTQSIFCATLDGKQRKIQDLGNNHILSSLIHKEGGLRYVNYPWLEAANGRVRPLGPPQLVKVRDSGAQSVLQTLQPFTAGFAGHFFTAIIGDTHWAIVNPCDVSANGKQYGYELCVISLTSKHDIRRQKIGLDSSLPFAYRLCQFCSGDQELLLAKFADMTRDPSVPNKLKKEEANFSQFLRVKLA